MLREWRLACPVSELDLAFPTASGSVDNLPNISRRGLGPVIRGRDQHRPKASEIGLDPTVVSPAAKCHLVRSRLASAPEALNIKGAQIYGRKIKRRTSAYFF
jgi:hypothetical protein